MLLACSDLCKKFSENNKHFIKKILISCFFATPWAGALCLGAVDLPWQDQLCCDSPSARLAAGGADAHVPERNRSASHLPHPHPRCSYRKSTTKSEEFSGGKSLFTCVSCCVSSWHDPGACCVWSQVFHTLPWLSCAGEDSFHHNCKDCCLSVGGHPTLYPPTSSEISHSQLVISPCTLMITHNKRFTINKTFSNDCLVVFRCTWKICETIMHKTTLVGALKKYISRHIASALKPSQEDNIISFGEFGHYT